MKQTAYCAECGMPIGKKEDEGLGCENHVMLTRIEFEANVTDMAKRLLQAQPSGNVFWKTSLDVTQQDVEQIVSKWLALVLDEIKDYAVWFATNPNSQHGSMFLAAQAEYFDRKELEK
ncbi:MAG: hypothetical protein HXX08_11210 [Chloroflexi bacterium]|uniref:Uncharacterized protein n=1 Tax=Candidatus Chlorohelix allophototropha TaxID=3003348 RepID=A0A8T7LZI0_9CHLR|nr:hypothetical protein [Chloroflexota bacterium]WJW65805.1 hypothetical protein OZ401_001584 [Chloroflexota bacterium L227-S17]